MFLPVDQRTAMFRYIRFYESGRLEYGKGELSDIVGGFYTSTVSDSGDHSVTFFDELGAFVVKSSLSEDDCILKIPGVPEPYEADLAECLIR